MNKYPRKFRFMFNTQGKNSRVRQNQKLTLSKIGQIWKPAVAPYTDLKYQDTNTEQLVFGKDSVK